MKKKYGTQEIKELIDLAHNIVTLFAKKQNFWTWLFGNSAKIRRAVLDSIKAWEDRKDLINEIKDLDEAEQLELNKYAKFVFGYGSDASDFIEHLIKGTDHLIKAWEIVKGWR